MQGTEYFFRGMRLLKRRELRPFVIGPIAINTVVFAAFITWAVSSFGGWMEQLLPALPEWLSWLEILLWPLFILLLLLALVFGFSLAANLIAAPFNGLLAEKADQLLGHADAQPITAATLLRLIPRTLLREVQKIGYILPMVLVAALCSLIPVINWAAPVWWFLLGAWMMALEYADYTSDNRGQSFAALKEALRARRWDSLGFGAVCSLFTLIPIVNLLAMPAAVCGGVLFWRERLAGESPQTGHGA